jgi:hypothetical protein
MSVPLAPLAILRFSLDGGWLALSCEERGAWQPHIMNLRTTEQQLTNADCNSVSPVWRLILRISSTQRIVDAGSV